MMNLRKKTLALALTAAVVGGGASLAQAQVLNPGSLGQALIYPYLVANATGWTSFFHLINTSNTQTAAVKLRLRSAVDSSDVYDIIVVLSPSDMWTGTLERQGSTVGFRATDNTCTVPNYGKDVFVPLTISASEVYAEAILMGVSATTAVGTVGAAAKHNAAGVPADCGAVALAFASPAGAAFTTAEFNNSLNVAGATNILTGKYDLINVGLGQSGAGRATALQNFGAPAVAQPNGSRIANTNMWGQFAGDWDHPTLAEGSGGLTGVNAVLSKTVLINEWVLNPNLGELSSWIVNFPTKTLTVDAITTFNALPAANVNTFGTGNGNCVSVTASLFNREEAPLILASPGANQLCNEVNVISFRNGSINSSTVLNSAVDVNINTGTQTGVLAGWMNLQVPTNPALAANILPTFGAGAASQTTLPPWIAAPVAVAGATQGRPVIGFNLTARTTPADAVVYDHAYQ